MLLEEVKIFFKEELNPKLWNGKKLKKQVEKKLKLIADEFIDFLDIKKLPVEDITITGSNANYNWTQHSDIDLHIIIDFKKLEPECEDYTEDYFSDKKTIWNNNHDITIYNIPVELYVQDVNEKHVSSGVYSIKKSKWIVEPSKKVQKVDNASVKQKANDIKKQIDDIIKNKGSFEAAEKLKEKIQKLRKSGLDKGGEFSVENLAFKELRKSGYIDKLYEYSKKAKSTKLSLE